MDKPIMIDPQNPKMLDEMLVDLFTGLFPTDTPERRAIKAASIAAALRAKMKAERLTVVRLNDFVVIDTTKDYTLSQLEEAGLDEMEYIDQLCTIHITGVAKAIQGNNLAECAIGTKEDDPNQKRAEIKTRLFVPGIAQALADAGVELTDVEQRVPADATIQ